MLSLLVSTWLFVAAQNTSSLQGIVIRADTSEPVSNVEISLVPDLSTGIRARTNEQGAFTFENLPFGKYNVYARREGYFTYPQGSPLPSAVANVTLDSGRTQQIVINLIAGAVISGRITDSEGHPLQGVQMSAMKLQYDAGRPVFAAGTPPIGTDARGDYRISWLPPGEYHVRAECPVQEQEFARRTYYPGTTDSLNAVPLIVRGGDSINGTDFAIPHTGTIRLSGQVTTEGQFPSSGVVRTFYLMPQDGRPQEAYPFELTNVIQPPIGRATANFMLETRGIPPGSYDLVPFFLDPMATYHTGRTRVEIGNEDLENLRVVVNSNVDVSGRILVDGNLLLPGLSALQLQLRAAEPAIPLMSRSSSAMMAGDGTFVIRGLTAGRYYVFLAETARMNSSLWYVSAMRQGGVDIRHDGIVDVRPGTLPLEITLSPGAGTITGVVDAPGGSPPIRADVVLVPQFSRRSNRLFYDRTGIDDTGHFKFEGVAPGEYKVFAFEQLQESAEQNPAFIARYETLGQSVTVSSGSFTEVRTRLLR